MSIMLKTSQTSGVLSESQLKQRLAAVSAPVPDVLYWQNTDLNVVSLHVCCFWRMLISKH